MKKDIRTLTKENDDGKDKVKKLEMEMKLLKDEYARLRKDMVEMEMLLKAELKDEDARLRKDEDEVIKDKYAREIMNKNKDKDEGEKRLKGPRPPSDPPPRSLRRLRKHEDEIMNKNKGEDEGKKRLKGPCPPSGPPPQRLRNIVGMSR